VPLPQWCNTESCAGVAVSDFTQTATSTVHNYWD
jgi:hypothetical protein